MKTTYISKGSRATERGLFCLETGCLACLETGDFSEKIDILSRDVNVNVPSLREGGDIGGDGIWSMLLIGFSPSRKVNEKRFDGDEGFPEGLINNESLEEDAKRLLDARGLLK